MKPTGLVGQVEKAYGSNLGQQGFESRQNLTGHHLNVFPLKAQIN